MQLENHIKHYVSCKAADQTEAVYLDRYKAIL